MATLKIPTPLRPYAGGKNLVTVKGNCVGEVMQDLVAQFPALKKHLYNDADELRPFVTLYLGEEDIRHLQGVDTPVKEGDRLMIVPSIAGG